MNDMNQPPIDAYDDFPEVGSHPQMGEQQQKKDDRKGFQNPLYPNDSVTTCSGFINEIRSYDKNGDTLFFVRAGLIDGSRKNDNGEWVGDITNCDLLVGSTLKKWAESMKPHKEAITGIRMNFVIRNRKGVAEIYEGKPILKTKGVLEVVTIGHLDQ